MLVFVVSLSEKLTLLQYAQLFTQMGTRWQPGVLESTGEVAHIATTSMGRKQMPTVQVKVQMGLRVLSLYL